MTKVINLYGASGVGKSTTAAALFAEMKMRNLSCELVTEFVKSWAYEKRPVGKFDEVYLFGKQARRESILYEKVDYIITDSPLWLYPFYEMRYIGKDIIGTSVKNYLEYVKEHNIQHINFFLERYKIYNPNGRYETEEESKENHELMRKFLTDNNVDFTTITAMDRERVDFILNYLGI